MSFTFLERNWNSESKPDPFLGVSHHFFRQMVGLVCGASFFIYRIQMSPEGVFDDGQVRVLVKIGGVWGAKDGWGPSVWKPNQLGFWAVWYFRMRIWGDMCFFLTKMVGHPEGRLTLRCEHIDLRLQTESANWRTDVDQMIKWSTHPGLQRKVVPFKTNDASIKCVSSGSVKIWTSKKPHWIHTWWLMVVSN